MRLLVAGLTGQLGAGLRALAADDHDLRLVAVRRPGSPRALGPGEAEEVVVGDVRRPMWGLDPAALTGVDAVVNLAAETNWVASSRDLYAVNALGAAHGHQLTRELAGRGGRVIPYVHAGSVYVAGGAVGEIAERPVPPAGDRTAYERSKWLAEQRLLSAAADPGGPAPVLIARMPALVGDSGTGRTLRRNSLYLLADRWSDLPGNVLPAMRDARVDALPRDVAAGTLLRLVRAVVRRPPSGPVICHAGLGETAPSLRGLLAAARTAGAQRHRGEPRLVTVGARALLWSSLNAERVLPLGPSARNALIGLRYIGLDRVFSRPVLADLLGEDLPAVGVDVLARLIFGAAPNLRDDPAGNGSMARFPG
ncbi:SDR family oxidoreductase [Micromonospora sp. KC207]|uniref:SDR family oxidoreductase n=1 Tax=Micromonospora sp. KC207 TaxID=2530377 RepID=UPI0014048E6A|nr:SDR family oxidoreductase [Micromonospora sp. KC207]